MSEEAVAAAADLALVERLRAELAIIDVTLRECWAAEIGPISPDEYPGALMAIGGLVGVLRSESRLRQSAHARLARAEADRDVAIVSRDQAIGAEQAERGKREQVERVVRAWAATHRPGRAEWCEDCRALRALAQGTYSERKEQ